MMTLVTDAFHSQKSEKNTKWYFYIIYCFTVWFFCMKIKLLERMCISHQRLGPWSFQLWTLASCCYYS
jgi:hypothetical protein